MEPRVATPIFSRVTNSSRRYSNTIGFSNNNSQITLKVDQDLNLRVVQLEVAEQEACKLILTLCQDASEKLAITDTEYVIDDVLSGILLLGNLCKRVGIEKDNLNAIVEEKNNDYLAMEAEKDTMVHFYVLWKIVYLDF